MHKNRKWLLATMIATATLAGCATSPTANIAADNPIKNTPGGSHVYLIVRHAEKQTEPSDNPGLTNAGLARAQRLADDLAEAPVTAVYATDYLRTQQTAAPTAAAHGLPVTGYDARQPAAAFAARLRDMPTPGTVLVVGHSNTAPAIAAALCQCEVAAMDEQEYDRRLRVEISADGRATLETLRDY